MLPGTSSAFIANQAAMAAHNAAVFAAVQTTFAFSRNAAVLELADRLLGEFSEEVIASLNVSTSARRVLISAERQRHAIRRRQIAAKGDAELVASRLVEAFAHVEYLMLPQRPRVFALVGLVPSVERYLVLALKLVAGDGSKPDEWWVQTAHPLGRKKFRKAHASGKLIRLGAS